MDYIVKEDGHAYRRYDAGNGCTIEENVGIAQDKIELSYANGQITAVVKDFLGNVKTDFNDPIIFDVDGAQVKALPANGQASIPVGATCTVRTVNEGIGNGELKVEVGG